MIFGEFWNITSRYLSQIPRRNRAIFCLYYKAKKFRISYNTRTHIFIKSRAIDWLYNNTWLAVIFTCKYFKFGLNTTGLGQSHFRNFLVCSIIKEIQLQVWQSFKFLFYSCHFVCSLHLRTSRLKAHNQKMFNMILNFEYFNLAKILTFHYLSGRSFVA